MKKYSNIERQAIYWSVKIRSCSLSDLEYREFEDWLEQSAHHQMAYIEAERLWVDGRHLERKVKSEAMTRSVGVIGAASFILTFLFIFISIPENPQVHESIYISEVGELKEVSLADGSMMVMATNSSAKYTDGENVRVLDLYQGEIYLSVKHDSLRPFLVKTDSGLVRVVGTKFTVKHSVDDMAVVVEDGRVAVSNNNIKDSSGKEILLKQGQMITLKSIEAGEEPISVDVDKALSWRKGYLRFDDTPVSEILHEINKHMKTRVVTKSKKILKRRLTITIQLDAIEGAPQLISSALHCSYKKLESEDIEIY